MHVFLNNKIRRNQGMSILEVLIASTIITIGILALIKSYGVYVAYALSQDKNVQATYLLEEGLEAMTLLRDQSWTSNIASITTATTSLYFNGTSWIMSSTTNEYIDGAFVRNVKVAAVTRDADGKIAASGTADTGTKLVTVTVAFKQNSGTTTESLSKYLVNIYNN